MHTLTLTPPAHARKSTKIVIGDDAISGLTDLLSEQSYDRIALLYDAGIESIATKLKNSIGPCITIPVGSGDASKSLAEVERITALMLDAGCTRKTLLICVGGGMLTDLGGFIASVFMRGIACLLVPTSLLGMIDAAIGGKTAVNAGGRKNMIGTVTHPLSVIVDTALLQPLPEAQLSEGMVEVIKIAAMVDRPFFEWLEANMTKLIACRPEEVSECVLRAIEAKIRIVEHDEHDRDQRLLLNFGHTVGHAVEALSSYTLSHGTAVSIGMVAEMTMAKTKDAERISALLKAIKMPTAIPNSMTSECLWTAMLTDKKNEGGAVRIAVPARLGEGKVQSIDRAQFQELFT